MSWVQDEFSKVNLNDKRLNFRLIKTTELLSAHPSQSINRSIEDYNDKKAAYRLFDNDKCTAEKIFSPHRNRTIERISGHKRVLSLHDTSFLNYDSHVETTGLGNIGGHSTTENEDGVRGLIFHGALAVSETGIPLGLQSIRIWSRPDVLEWAKESERWIEGLQRAKATVKGDTQMVFITDREGDQFDLINESIELKCDLVIRSKHDRKINGKDYYLSWHLKKKIPAGIVQIDDPKNKRKAEVSISYSKISFNDPDIKRGEHLRRHDVDRVEVYVVEAKEKNPPAAIAGLHWILLTTLPVNDIESALLVVDYYRKRWNIESYFKVLKKGCCEVEDCRLQTRDRLEKYLTLFSIIAWRLYWMVHVGRTDPKMDSGIILTEIEKRTLYCHINKTKDLKKMPKMTVRNATRSIAKMGGFNGRKGDGHPGMITLWRGWIRLQDKVEMYEIMSS